MEMVKLFGLSCIFTTVLMRTKMPLSKEDKDGDPEMTVLFHEAA